MARWPCEYTTPVLCEDSQNGRALSLSFGLASALVDQNLAPYGLRCLLRRSTGEISHPTRTSAALPWPTVSSQVMIWTLSVSGHARVIIGFCSSYAK